MSSVTVPEQLIATLIKTGVAALSNNIALLDPVLAGMTVHDRDAIKDYWGSNPPSVLSGYARAEGPFPCVSVVLQSEQTLQDYVGLGQEYETFIATPDGSDDHNVFKRRVTGSYALHVMAEHPDICLAYYRIIRRIISVGYRWLINRDMYDPTLSGQELGPDARYSPEHLFIRKLILSVEYEEEWRDNDALATALELVENSVAIPHGEAGNPDNPGDPGDPNYPMKNFGHVVHEDGGNGPAADDPSVYPGWKPIGDG
jgi:hypothetical protein